MYLARRNYYLCVIFIRDVLLFIGEGGTGLKFVLSVLTVFPGTKSRCTVSPIVGQYVIFIGN